MFWKKETSANFIFFKRNDFNSIYSCQGRTNENDGFRITQVRSKAGGCAASIRVAARLGHKCGACARCSRERCLRHCAAAFTPCVCHIFFPILILFSFFFCTFYYNNLTINQIIILFFTPLRFTHTSPLHPLQRFTSFPIQISRPPPVRHPVLSHFTSPPTHLPTYLPTSHAPPSTPSVGTHRGQPRKSRSRKPRTVAPRQSAKVCEDAAVVAHVRVPPPGSEFGHPLLSLEEAVDSEREIVAAQLDAVLQRVVNLAHIRILGRRRARR